MPAPKDSSHSPWAGHGPPEAWRNARHAGGSPFRRHGRPAARLFVRFVSIFGLFVLLLFGGLGLVAYLAVKLAGGSSPAAAAIWLGMVTVVIALPVLAGWFGRRAYRTFAAPLSELLAAAEQVGEGNLEVRVRVPERGDFGALAGSFNRMVEELALADRRRRNLTADVAHELRTPLQIIQGNLEGLLDGVYAPTPEHIGATLDETRLLARLVEDLRVLSQAEAGELPLTREPVDVAELLADVATSFSGQAQAGRVTLTAQADPETPTIFGDYGRLDQVLSNLAGNALRHTPTGGKVALRAAPVPGGVRIEVSDTGEGILPEDLPFIFDRFWRGSAARAAESHNGSGLGLTIARRLVEAHGGRIEVASTSGQGTTFTAYLPAGEPH